LIANHHIGLSPPGSRLRGLISQKAVRSDHLAAFLRISIKATDIVASTDPTINADSVQ
jgi:hypothetical protein